MNMYTRLTRLATAACLILSTFASPGLLAQTAREPDTVILVAAPNLVEPTYRKSVLIVTAIEGDRFIGIIINRPTRRTLSSLFPEHGPSKAVVEPVFFGGPMSGSAVFALAKNASFAGNGSIPILKDLYLAITVNVVDKLIEEAPNDARYYVGNVLWRPGELQDEIRRGVWTVLNANPEFVFSKDPEHLWEELAPTSRGIMTDAGPGVMTIAHSGVHPALQH